MADRPDDREPGGAARGARYLVYAALARSSACSPSRIDGIYIGATWTRDMRNLMIVALALYLGVWWLTLPLGNTGLWIAILVFFGSRGALQAARYPALVRRRSGRPRLRRDGGGIAPDRIARAIEPSDAQEIEQIAF